MVSTSSAGCGSTARAESVGGPSSLSAAEQAASDQCARLSRGQLEVLRLVNRHLSSKEIAAELGISSHTVDQRVRGAIRILGVTRRSEAARLVDMFDRAAGVEAAAPETYQRLIHQPPHIDATPDPLQSEGAVSSQIRHADRTRGAGTVRLETEQSADRSQPPLFPWSTSQQVRNTWSAGTKLAVIAGIAILSSFSAGMLLAGLESLSRLLQS